MSFRLRCISSLSSTLPESINQIALLQVRYNDTLRLIAKGPEAEEALIAFRQLAEDNFGETEEVAPPTLRPVPPVSGKAFYYQPVLCTVQAKSTLTVEEEQDRLRQAIDFTLLDLMTLTAKAEASGLDDIAAIFSGHHTLLDDPVFNRGNISEQTCKTCIIAPV